VVSGGPSDDSSVTCATLHPCHHYHQMIVLDVMFPNLLRTYVQHAAQVLDVMFPNLLRTYVQHADDPSLNKEGNEKITYSLNFKVKVFC
jgi:hypothetical protein